MAKRRGPAPVTKKHLARAQREKRQMMWILGGAIVVAITVVALILFGLAERYLTSVAEVNGDEISTYKFQGQVRLAYTDTINRGLTQNDLVSVQAQLANPEAIGQEVLDQMIDDMLIKQEAIRRGFVVTEDDVDKAIAEAFGFYPEGTPTPLPTRTPNPTLTALASITPTVTEGPSPTPTATFTPGPSPTVTSTPTTRPTSTPFTEEAFHEQFQSVMQGLDANFDVSEEDFRLQFESMLYRRFLIEAFEEEVPREEEHVLARHILVEEEETANEVLDRLDEGEEWEVLASEYSIDESNKDLGGDLGWFPRGQMVPEFEDAVFSGEIEEIVGPVETSFGWHIIHVMDKEIRELDSFSFQLAIQSAFVDWLKEVHEESDIVINPRWIARIPEPPDLNRFIAPQVQ